MLYLVRFPHLTLTFVKASIVGSGTKVYGIEANLICIFLL
jgi:hypothetical protein